MMRTQATFADAVVSDGGLTSDSPMPWGKHKGLPIRDVPQGYLAWALNNADHMSASLRSVIEHVLGISGEDGGKNTRDDFGLRAAWENATRRVQELEREIRAIKAEAEAEAEARRKQEKFIGTISDRDRFERIIRQWFRAMSLIHHPDHGGSAQAQTIVNACYADLMKRLMETN